MLWLKKTTQQVYLLKSVRLPHQTIEKYKTSTNVSNVVHGL